MYLEVCKTCEKNPKPYRRGQPCCGVSYFALGEVGPCSVVGIDERCIHYNKHRVYERLNKI